MGALTHMDGFDLYAAIGDISQKWALDSGSTTNGSLIGGRFSGQAIRTTVGNFSMAWSKGLAATTSLALGFAFRMTSLPSSAMYIHQWALGSAGGVGLVANADGTMSLKNAAGTTIFTTSSLAANTWYYFEFEMTFSTTVGVYKMWIDSIQVANLSAQALTANTTALQWGSRQSRGGTVGTFDIDDLYLVTGASSIRLGEARIDVVVPESDTATKQFTPSTGATNFSCIDETLASTADYLVSANVGDTDLYNLANLSSVPAGIFAVQACATAQKTDAGARSILLPVKQGATQSDGASIPVTSSYSRCERIMEVDPTDGLPWTYAKVNAMIGGIKVA